MAFLQKFLRIRTQSQRDAVPEPSHDVVRPKRITTVVVRWACSCTEVWARRTEAVEAVCSICGGQFELDGRLTVSQAHQRSAI
jgi:hypothetical protein